MRIPASIFVLPLLLAGLIGVLNIQWLHLYQLINAPQADSLVYLTEAYNDYWSIRSWDWGHLFQKYVTSGTQQTSPLLWGTASIFFLIFGLDPVVAYFVVILAYLIWVAGSACLAWVIYPSRDLAIASGIAVALLPSATSWGLRNFMLDFVAAAPFVWSTAILVQNTLFEKKREAVLYGLLVGLTVLFRTTAVVYFLSHVAIVGLQILQQRKIPNMKNMMRAFLVASLACGWFIIPNLERIFEYYAYWAAQAKAVRHEPHFWSNLYFYLKNIKDFHLGNSTITLTLYAILSACGLLAVGLGQYPGRFAVNERTLPLSKLLIIPALVFVPMIGLAFFPYTSEVEAATTFTR